MPEPVGATTRVCSPRATASHAPSWAGVGAAKAPSSQAWVAAAKRVTPFSLPRGVRQPRRGCAGERRRGILGAAGAGSWVLSVALIPWSLRPASRPVRGCASGSLEPPTRAAGAGEPGPVRGFAGPTGGPSASPAVVSWTGRQTPAPRARLRSGAALVSGRPHHEPAVHPAAQHRTTTFDDNNGRPSGGPISSEPRINDRIRVPEVRLVGPEGEQVGIVPIGKALELAAESDLDLVEVAPMARPPVCKLMDYGKFKYESAQKAREARRNQALTVIKEMKLRPKIDSHDYETKKGHVERFLKAGDKVKVTIMFRGREQSRPELGSGCCSASPRTSPSWASWSPRRSRTAATWSWSSRRTAPREPRAPAAPPSAGRKPPHNVRRRRDGSSSTAKDRIHRCPRTRPTAGSRSASRSPGAASCATQHAGMRHNLEHKPSRLTRRLTGTKAVSPRRRAAGEEAARPLSPAPRPDHPAARLPGGPTSRNSTWHASSGQ